MAGKEERILRNVKRQIVSFIAVASVLLVIFGTIYMVAQQSQRRAANNPQIQLAEDTANSLRNGVSPSSFFISTMQPTGIYQLYPDRIDIRASLAPFVIIYDRAGHVLAGNGYLDGQLPVIPIGVLTSSNHNEFHAVTWQPAARIRVATVSVSADNYYVISGRNIREVESGQAHSLVLVAFGYVASLLVVMVYFVCAKRFSMFGHAH